MNSIKTLICILFLSHSLIFAQWEKQTNGLPESWKLGWAVDACDSLTIIFSASQSYPMPDLLYLSSDQGMNWENISPLIERGEGINDVSMIDKDNIWLVTSAVDSARILHTPDGGINWKVQYNDSTKTKFFNYIKMFDELNGIAMGDSPKWKEATSDSNKALFLRTSDGGENWIEMENSHPIRAAGDIWRRMDFVTADLGYFAENFSGSVNQGITKTIDGGNNWEVIYPDIGIQLMKFYDENIGLVRHLEYTEGESPTYQILRTLDGGETWQTFVTDSTGWANDFEFIPGDPSQVWFTDHNNLFYSSDTGKTWVSYNIDPDGRDIVFVDERHGWLLGDNGNLFYTDNNGGIITDVEKIENEEIPNEIALYQNYPNPFNPVTTIKYSVPFVGASHVLPIQLKVYDVIGNQISVLVDAQKSAGNYEVTFDGSNLSSGIYYYQLTAGNFITTNKMILLK